MRKIILLALMFQLALFFFPIVPEAQAQDNTFDSATFTEAFLDAKLQARIHAPDSPLTSGHLDLQPGQIVITGSGTSGQGAVIDVKLTVAVILENGQVTFKATGINVNGIEFDTSQATQFTGQTGIFGDIQLAVTSVAQRHTIESLDVSDTSLNMTWQREEIDQPGVMIVDNRVSMTVSEDYINSLPAITRPSDTQLTDVHIDFQPQQLTMTANRHDANGSSLPVSITATPSTYNGLATWSIIAMEAGEISYDASQIGQLNDDIVRSWYVFFSGLYRAGMLANIALTDDSLTLIWDTNLNTGLAFEPNNRSLVVTEEYINNTLQVRSPADYTISHVVVDLQPDQVIVTANLDLPGGTVLKEQATFVATVDDGFIVWTVTSATLDGTPLDSTIIDRFNDATSRWLNLGMWRDFSLYNIGWVTITDTQIEISGRPH